MLVLDRVDEQDDRSVQPLSGNIPVALIDRSTLASLPGSGAADTADP
ncbi:hypothetical protein TVNIR_1721 [Thioalkalivibrio nitratireducens DSM 14787]|uniref:Uncharacterized protein n=1 Tax=Thioalkalivibrio nitratireducens (strain DSM 14787 / UNIQEM 213 / ALEN2) TaxID=1255043 RepID=L0DWI3_THIND|nr:hypothetical protein [Thioalkalivibrio nitratireducens]AGA33383.1 hypothetical protein TVNIR_1721 [Thioalkalivibrio nitratireducens DSM 14787]